MTQGQLPLVLAPMSPEAGGESRSSGYSGSTCERPGCGDPVPPQARGGASRRYCSRRCQTRHYEECNPRVPAPSPKKKKKAPSNADRILARLSRGPATGMDLLRAGGGTRYGARIDELREAGHRIIGPVVSRKHGITETTEPTEDGHDVYRLEQ